MPSPRSTKKRKRQMQAVTDDQRMRYEIAGILTATIGLVTFVSMVSGDRGVASAALREALTLTFGLGGWVIPVLLVATGLYLCLSVRPLRFSLRLLPIPGLVLVALAAAQLGAPADAPFDEAFLMGRGGYIGAAAGYALVGLFGPTGGAFLLGGIALALVSILATRPISDYALTAYDRAGGAAEQVRTRMSGIAEDRRRRRIAQRSSRSAEAKSAPPREPRRQVRAPEVHASAAAAAATDAPAGAQPQLALFEAPTQAIATADVAQAAAETAGKPTVPPFLQKGVRAMEAAPPPPPTPLTHAPVPGKPKGPWQYPPLDLLDSPVPADVRRQERETAENIQILEDTLASFKIGAKVVSIERGPAITRYEVEPEPGIRVARISALADDLARVLEAVDVRIEAPVPGKSVIGIEVPSKNRSLVGMREILESELMRNNKSHLAFTLGKDIAGDVQIADLCRMPHLLVAGATNSGKSVCLNALILSILFRATPDEVKFMMIDPKRVELSLYEDIPHLVAPVVHDAREAAGLLRHAIVEMESRYRTLAALGVRNINEYMELRDEDPDLEPMPYLVIVIDELADLMMQAAAEFEQSICRIAQLARAVGIHLVVATQRPSVNVVTGTIKANIPSRIAFMVSSQTDSRVILDSVGADRLVGQGDMLYSPIDASKPRRIQGAYLCAKEINRVVDFLKRQAEPDYTMEPLPVDTMKTPVELPAGVDEEGVDDDMFAEIVRFVQTQRRVSTSMLQRKFRIGYNRAARLIEILEDKGLVGPADGSRPRRVLHGVFGGPYDDDEGLDEAVG
jgi:DNA segregation ATPase FtsK/SpoIIIE, S-DNA-T family